jgi:hypothetical protein
VRIPHFIGANGALVTLTHLPPRGLRRWLPHQKAIVVAAVRHGLITFNEACERYDLSADEYLSWQRSFDAVPSPAATAMPDQRD